MHAGYVFPSSDVCHKCKYAVGIRLMCMPCLVCVFYMFALYVRLGVQVNHCIRKITFDGEVVTVAGTPQVCVCVSLCVHVCLWERCAYI